MSAIRCHDAERTESAAWWASHGRSVPEPAWVARGHGRRHCTWCGSLHPDDLLTGLADVAPRLVLAVECAHGGHTDVRQWRACVESLRGIEGDWAGMSDSPWSYGWPHKFGVRLPDGTATRFYCCHLNDLPAPQFAAVAALVSRHTGVEFLRDDAGRLCFTTALSGLTGV